jgi:hypothetical protein
MKGATNIDRDLIQTRFSNFIITMEEMDGEMNTLSRDLKMNSINRS